MSVACQIVQFVGKEKGAISEDKLSKILLYLLHAGVIKELGELEPALLDQHEVEHLNSSNPSWRASP